MNKKKVILIGGTSFSGSTIIDLILSNTAEGVSVGEQHALFFPYKKHHLTHGLDHDQHFINFWNSVKKDGPKYIFRNIFKQLPDKNYIVDSSKDLYWISLQNKYLKKQGYDVKNVLVWKEPEAFAKSYLKRGKTNWENTYVNYHRYFLSLINNPIKIHLSRFLGDFKYAGDVSSQLGIVFQKNMLKYWNNKSYTLFGSTSTKISLYDQNSEAFKKANKIIDRRPGKEFNTFNYQQVSVEEKANVSEIDKTINLNLLIKDMVKLLNNEHIASNKIVPISRIQLLLKSYKSRLRSFAFVVKRRAGINK